MDFIKFLKGKEPKRALVFGMGGGGDIVATIPTASFLKEFGYETFHGSIVWDRYVIDPKPGPRAVEELESCKIVNETIAIAYPETTVNGIELTVSKAAKHFGEVVCLDITKGPKKLANGLKDFMEKESVSVLISIDSGGDVLAYGFESGLRSPLADSISLAAISEIEDSIVGVFGFGSDGELRIEELLERIAFQMKVGGFLGCVSMGEEDFKQMKTLTEDVTTEASLIPLKAFEGNLGLEKIRFGRTVPVSPLSILTFYFRSSKLYESNVLAKSIIKTENIEDARRILNSLGIFTEMDFEFLIERKEIRWE
ncbi:hypothetical protein DRP07_03290 [Archaeoglobales archaeon]|nr:MAG: hypothetical protein DRP07_03290 [Archaeoglobales archaeon]